MIKYSSYLTLRSLITILFVCVNFYNHADEPKEKVIETPWETPKKNYPGHVMEDVVIQSYYEDLNKVDEVKDNGKDKSLIDKVKEADEEEKKDDTTEHPPYRIHVGDLFTVSVYGEAGSQRTIRVDPTGSLSYLFINDIQVLGKTIDELREILNKKLDYFYKFPLVVIIPRELYGNSYTILGQVFSPGTRKIVGNTTILTAICDAGGFQTRLFRQQTIDRVDLEHSFLARNGKYYPVDFVRLIRDGDLSQDIPLIDGDYLYFPMYYTDQIFVLGEVGSQRGINYVNPMSLMKAIAQSGGTTERASSRVVVLRGSLACPVRYIIDFNRIVKGYARDFPLVPGDIVYVPPRQFTSIRELWKYAVQSWVSQAASTAGTNTYLNVNPRALSTGVVSPSPVIGGGGAVAIPTASVGTAATGAP